MQHVFDNAKQANQQNEVRHSEDQSAGGCCALRVRRFSPQNASAEWQIIIDRAPGQGVSMVHSGGESARPML